MSIYFSIVTVCFNSLDDLKLTKTSVDEQSCQDFEWIVVDGASKDGTAEWLKENCGDGVKFISEVDRGIYDAMNKGIEMAEGEYITFLNSGDFFASNSVLRDVKQLSNADGADFLYGDSLELDEADTLFAKRSRDHTKVWYGMFAHHQTMFFRRELCSPPLYRLNYKIGADYAFVCEFLKKSKKIGRLDFPVCVFRLGGVSSVKWLDGISDGWRIRRDFLGTPLYARVPIAVVQVTIMLVRKYFPAVYSKLRFVK